MSAVFSFQKYFLSERQDCFLSKDKVFYMALIGSGHLNVGLHITDGLTRSIKDKSVFELRVVKVGVEAALFKKFLMRTFFDDVALVHD